MTARPPARRELSNRNRACIQAEARTFPLLLMFGEGVPAAPDPAAALAAALPGLYDAAALVAATQVSVVQVQPCLRTLMRASSSAGKHDQ